MSGPNDKWVAVPVTTIAETLVALNLAAQQVPPTIAVPAECTDGAVIFVGSYSEEES